MQSQHRKTKEKAKKIWPYWDWESMAGQQSQTTVTLELEDGLKIVAWMLTAYASITLRAYLTDEDLCMDTLIYGPSGYYGQFALQMDIFI